MGVDASTGGLVVERPELPAKSASSTVVRSPRPARRAGSAPSGCNEMAGSAFSTNGGAARRRRSPGASSTSTATGGWSSQPNETRPPSMPSTGATSHRCTASSLRARPPCRCRRRDRARRSCRRSSPCPASRSGAWRRPAIRRALDLPGVAVPDRAECGGRPRSRPRAATSLDLLDDTTGRDADRRSGPPGHRPSERVRCDGGRRRPAGRPRRACCCASWTRCRTAEIAAVLGRSEGAVRVLIDRALGVAAADRTSRCRRREGAARARRRSVRRDERERLEVEALLTDRYLESLFASLDRHAVAAPAASISSRTSAPQPRCSPRTSTASIPRSGSRSASRRDSRGRRPAACRRCERGRGCHPVRAGPAAQRSTRPRPMPSVSVDRPLLIGGALTSAALSVAAPTSRWRRGGASGTLGEAARPDGARGASGARPRTGRARLLDAALAAGGRASRRGREAGAD